MAAIHYLEATWSGFTPLNRLSLNYTCKNTLSFRHVYSNPIILIILPFKWLKQFLTYLILKMIIVRSI